MSSVKGSNISTRPKLEELIAVGRVDYYVAYPGLLEDTERYINACHAKSPNSTVKVSEALHCLCTNLENYVPGFEVRSFSWTAG